LPGQIPGFVGDLIEGNYTIGDWTGTWQARPTYVTSDATGTHTTMAGSALAGLNHDGVADLIVTTGSSTFGCTGALLYDGWSVLTAAHCVTDSSGNVNTTDVSATWELSSGNITASAATIQVHPSYGGSVTGGYDVAVINFSSPIDSNVPRYDIYRDGGLSELDLETLKVGYGRGGFGEDGATTSAGIKRWGKNKWEDDGLGDDGVGGISNNPTQLTYDSDSNYRNLSLTGDDSDHDAFQFHFGQPEDLGFGDDEVMSASGDSGSPTFLLDDGVYKIAGVSSYILRLERRNGASSDVDTSLNSSWGEFGVDARLADADISAWVDSVVIPEPNTLAFLAAGGLWVRRKRR
jgi:hypothetical protein